MSSYTLFDRKRLRLLPLKERKHDLHGDIISPLNKCNEIEPELQIAAKKLIAAKKANKARIFQCGAHVIRSGVQNYLFELMEQGFISCLVFNGACAIHDFEFALIGATTESVATYIKNGQFGLWKETGRLNDIINSGWKNGLGIGESVAREIANGNYAYKHYSIFAKAWECRIPITVHIGIGHDIIHEHPNCNGEALGGASYTDFLIFTNELEKLEHGCVYTFGSAIMAPEVFLKALAMVRNVAEQEGRSIKQFTSLVCDLQNLPQNIHEEAKKNDPRYYFRPWKTLLSRTVSDGGESLYVCGRHEHTIPALWSAIQRELN